MNIIIGSYDNGVYEVEIKDNKFTNSKKLVDAPKASYLMEINKTVSYLYLKDGVQYLKIENDDVLLDEGACHISYDEINNLVYVSFYGAGLLKVLDKIDNKWSVVNTYSYGSDSRIHYAQMINNINLVGVCDLGLNNFHLYSVENNNLIIVDTLHFNNNEGPRHFINHKTKPIVYILNELNPSITTVEYIDGKIKVLDTIKLDSGAGSAIRIDSNCEYLYAAVRDSNIIYSFKVLKNGQLELIQKVHSHGDHPRDFNITDDNKYLIAANMKSDQLTLYGINEGKINLLHKDYFFRAGCSIIIKNHQE